MNDRSLIAVVRKAGPAVRRLNKHLLTGPQPVAASADGAAMCGTGIKNPGLLPSADVNLGTFVIPCSPMGAPRMTRADAWRKRPVVLRYHAYKQTIRSVVGPIVIVPDAIEMRFFIPMPPSWSVKKQRDMWHQGHRSKPDIDNLEKGLMDALLPNDAGVWRTTKVKLWEYQSAARIELEVIYD